VTKIVTVRRHALPLALTPPAILERKTRDASNGQVSYIRRSMDAEAKSSRRIGTVQPQPRACRQSELSDELSQLRVGRFDLDRPRNSGRFP